MIDLDGSDQAAAHGNSDEADPRGFRMMLRPVSGPWMAAVVDEAGVWLREKNVDIDLSRDLRTVVDGRNIRVMHHRNNDASAFLLSMSETNSGGTFTTTLLGVEDPTDPQLMVRVTNDRNKIVPAPRIVRRLLERIELRDGAFALSPGVGLLHPGDLDDFIARVEDDSRRGVVLAVGTGDVITPALIVPRLEVWARDVAGLAQTAVLTPEATAEFQRLAGSYRVPEGTIRTFRPGVSLEEQWLARSHRMLAPQTVANRADWQIRSLLASFARSQLAVAPVPLVLARWERIFERLLNRDIARRISVVRDTGGAVAVQQLSPELERIRATLGVPDLNNETLLGLVEAATAPSVDVEVVDEVVAKLDAVQAQKELLEDELNDARTVEWSARQEAVEADERAEAAQLELRTLHRVLRSRGIDPWELAEGVGQLAAEAPDLAGSWSDLAARREEWRSYGVVITAEDRPMFELERLDDDGRALAAAHSALTALAGYVRARRSGDHVQDFARYLEEQPPGYPTYPRQRYAPTETGWTKTHYGRERRMPVPSWVNASGELEMYAHLKLTKISNRDPRLYFVDATDPDGMFVVVVGYLGTHLTNRATARLN